MHKHIFLAPLLAGLLLSAGCNNPGIGEAVRQEVAINERLPTKQISIGQQALTVEVADTDERRMRGLSGRNNLSEGTGMLFDFTDTPNAQPSFWMKDMKFDLDLVWIKSGRVVEITANVPAPVDNSELPTYSPAGSVDYVLEVSAGWSEGRIVVGDSVKIY